MCNQPLDVYALESFLTFKLFNEQKKRTKMQQEKEEKNTKKNYCYY